MTFRTSLKRLLLKLKLVNLLYMKKQFLIIIFCMAAVAATLTGCHKPDYQAMFSEKVMDDLAATSGAVTTIDTLFFNMRGDTAVVDVQAFLQMDGSDGIREFTQNLQYVFVKNDDDFEIISKTKGRPKPAAPKNAVQ